MFMVLWSFAPGATAGLGAIVAEPAWAPQP
jgi:hypothetical protein